MPLLVIDDEASIREMLTELLEDAGYVVAQAVDGADALAQLGAGLELPCLILLDLMMPRMNGWELRAALQQHPELKTIPVVVLSAHTQLAQTAVALDVADYLTKPIDLDRLLSVVRRFCSDST
jgi:CheY-like chemotaxis protein